MIRKRFERLALLAPLFVLFFSSAPIAATAQTSFLVNSTQDSGPGSLRQAILDANANAGVDTIQFAIQGSGPHTIAPVSVLPNITEAVVVDGTTQPDYQGVPVIRLDGTNAGMSAAGFRVEAGASTIRGLAILHFQDGIVLRTNGENHIEANFIGIDVDGQSFAGNRRYGLLIWASADNVVGGMDDSKRNVISSNEAGGIRITQIGSQGNRVEGNFIGTDASAVFSVGNAAQGVLIDSSASLNIIGSADGSGGNVISGNEESGVVLRGGGTVQNQVLRNFVGVNRAGDDELPNNHYGVLLEESASDNVIEGNVIARNGFSGIGVLGAQSRRNRIVMNHIGIDAAGLYALPNDVHGITIDQASDTMVGGSEPEQGNIIAYNQAAGINIQSGVRIRVLGNAIFANNDSGIDLGSDGVTSNDSTDLDDGPNNLQNFPDLFESGLNGNDLIVKFHVDSEPNHSAFPLTIQFFQADEKGQGRRFLGEQSYAAAALADEKTYANLGSTTGVAEGDAIVVTATDSLGNSSEFSAVAVLGNITSVAASEPTTPTTFVVHQNYPNPFNPQTSIRFEMSETAEVSVTVYNILGERIATLADGRLAAGEHSISWNGTNANGRSVSSGIYLYHVKAGRFSEVRKMMLLR